MTGTGGDGSTPRVSVITTTFHTPAPLLATSLDSILAQTLDDLELVLVVDGPLGDEQRGVLDTRATDPRLRVCEPGRLGRAQALNDGLRAARAPLVAIHDADDASHRERLERQVQVLDRMPDVDLLGTGVRRTSAAAVQVDWLLRPTGAADVEVLDRKLLVGNPLVHSSLLARRASVLALGGYATDRRYQFDHDLYLRARDAGMGVARLDEPLVLKRMHADQVFEAAGPAVPRLVSAWRLQVAHARSEGPAARCFYVGAASVRLGARIARSSVRRIRARA